MCGIVGYLGAFTKLELERSLEAMAHRGPDDQGSFAATLADGRRLWLGHRRLAIVDLSAAGHQPMQREGFTIVFNGEIYNYRELRQQLLDRGASLRTHSDTEVILALWAERGAACLPLLKGMFAFAIWDDHQQLLTLARDRIGEKPLYYAQSPSGFAFASEVRTLLELGVVEREIDPDGLEAFLTFGSLADPFPLVRGVRSLEAGQVMTVSRDSLRTRTYWSVARIEPVHHAEDVVAETRRRLCAAVERCLVADVPVGVLLSGGIDSSANVVLLSERHSDLRTFSVVFDDADQRYDEGRFSRSVAERFATRHHEFRVTLADARLLVGRSVAAMDQPSHDGINTYLVTHAVRDAGVKVAVSGQGADELFLGYSQRRAFPWLLRAAHALPGPARALLTQVAARLPLRDREAKLVQTMTSDDPVAAAYLAGHSIFSAAGQAHLRGREVAPPTRFVRSAGGTDALDQMSRLELTNYLRGTLLRDGDQMSMAHALELRAPFVDADLIEWVVSLPTHLKVAADRNKPLLLDAIGPTLPREVWDRPKQGFGLPFDRWLRDGIDLRPLDPEALGLTREGVATVAERFRAGSNYVRYWSLVVLNEWCQRHRLGSRYL